MRWIVRHIDSWLAFARKLELGIEQMEEIILLVVITRDPGQTLLSGEIRLTRRSHFGVRVGGPDTSINFQFLPENARGDCLTSWASRDGTFICDLKQSLNLRQLYYDFCFPLEI